MEVILIERMPNLGNIGDKVKVRDGYARNYFCHRKKHFVLPKLALSFLKQSVLKLKLVTQRHVLLQRNLLRALMVLL